MSIQRRTVSPLALLILATALYPRLTCAAIIENRQPAAAAPYSQETQGLLATTYLGHAEELPDPTEPYEVLAKYLEYDSHSANKDLASDIVQWEALVNSYPTSRHALAGLARLYREKGESTHDTQSIRKSLDLYIRAMHAVTATDKIRYTKEIADLGVSLDAKTALTSAFTEILGERNLATLDRPHYYLALVDYADSLARLGDLDAAEPFFEKAIQSYPENNTEAVNVYVRRLLDQKRPAKALAVLDKRYSAAERIQQMLPAFLRMEALRMLNRNTRLAAEEIASIQDRASGAVGGYLFGSAPLEAKLSAIEPKFAHTIGEDDCRHSTYLDLYCDQNRSCFQVYVINLAEVLYNEARSETLGAQTAVLWTLRNRTLQNLKLNVPGGYCDTYVGGVAYRSAHPEWQTLPCNEYVNYPNLCYLSQWYCFTAHGATTTVGANQSQYNDAHVDTTTLFNSGAVYRAWRMLNGYQPDVSTGWTPPWLSGCSFGCATEPGCASGSPNFSDGSPNGPMEYLAYAYTAANVLDCKQLAAAVCSNASPNNYFWNRLDHLPTGLINVVSTSIQGWAADPDVPYNAISVQIYADGPKGGGGSYLGTTTANLVGGGSSYPGSHGFSFDLPSSYRTGTHTFYVYGVNASNGAAVGQLSNSPVIRY